MAITITKKKVAPVVEGPLLSDFAKEIDLLGKLAPEAEKIKTQVKALQDKLKPFNEAAAKVQAYVDALPADDDADKLIEKGAQFQIEIGKKGTSREVTDIVKVQKLLGKDVFLKIASVKLGDLDKYLTEPQRDEVIKKTRTSRTFKIAKRADA